MNPTLFNIAINARAMLRDSRLFAPAIKKHGYRKAKEKRTALQSYGAQTAQAVMDTLESVGCKAFLSFGTLLGAIREGGMIAYDDDMDFAVLAEEGFSWAVVQSALEHAGFSLVRQFTLEGTITEQAYDAGGFCFDVFGMFPNADNRTYRAFFYKCLDNIQYKAPGDRSVWFFDLPISGISSSSFEGMLLPIPSNAEEFLTLVYGPNWHMPDPNWVSGTGWFLLDGVMGHRQVFVDQ